MYYMDSSDIDAAINGPSGKLTDALQKIQIALNAAQTDPIWGDYSVGTPGVVRQANTINRIIKNYFTLDINFAELRDLPLVTLNGRYMGTPIYTNLLAVNNTRDKTHGLIDAVEKAYPQRAGRRMRRTKNKLRKRRKSRVRR